MMNAEQKRYMKAKAGLEKLEVIERQWEYEYIISKGIKNDDGKIPIYTWTIDDEETANNAIEEFSKIVEETGLWASILAARETLKVAEEKLLAYAISICPENVQDHLRKVVSTNYKGRMEIIEAVMKLDTRTVRR